MSKAIIYGLYDPRQPIEFINCRYVGQTERTTWRRLSEHIIEAKMAKSPRYVFKWIRSLLRDSVEPIIVVLEEVDQDGVEEDEVWFELIDDAERDWIAIGRQIGARLTNHNDGGRGNRGYVPTEETIRKIVETRMANGYTHSEETRQKMSKSAKGKPKSPEHRANLSAALTGKPLTPAQIDAAAKRRGVPHTEEHKAKQSESARNSPKVKAHGERRRGVPLPDSTKAAISAANTGNPKIVEAGKKGNAKFVELFTTDEEFAANWRIKNQKSLDASQHSMRTKRMQCDECGFISNPQGIGHHQTSFGHSGKTMLDPIEEPEQSD